MKIMLKKIIQLKNGLSKMRKRSQPCVIWYHNVSMLKNSEQYCQKVLQLYMPWQNESELASNKQSYEEKLKEFDHLINSNIKKHEPFINIECDDLNNSLILDSDEDNDNAEFAIINQRLIDFDVVSSTHK